MPTGKKEIFFVIMKNEKIVPNIPTNIPLISAFIKKLYLSISIVLLVFVLWHHPVWNGMSVDKKLKITTQHFIKNRTFENLFWFGMNIDLAIENTKDRFTDGGNNVQIMRDHNDGKFIDLINFL